MSDEIVTAHRPPKSAAARPEWIALGGLCALLAACSEPAPPPLWIATSRSIEVSCGDFFQGSMHFAATRDQLSAAQLDMLSSMTIIDAVPGCVADVMGCSLSVMQADATTTTLDALEMNSACDTPRKVVSFDTFEPFRRSLGCQYAKNLTFGQPAAAAPVPADARCFNGLFTTYDGGTISVALQVDDATPAHHIELDDCAQSGRIGKVSFTLLDTDGTTALGTSSLPADPGPNGACASLDQAFPHAGSFPLQIVAASGILPAGDFSLRFY